MKPTKATIRKIGQGGLSIVIFLLTIELSARVDDSIRYQAPLVGRYTADRLRTTDAEGIPHNVPRARFEKWANNALGFRGPEVSLSKPAGKRRIICMGVSETYGYYESSGKEWPARLRDLLSQDSDIEVINTAIVGLALDRYRPYLEKYVLPLSPDVVILFVNPFHYAALSARQTKSAINVPARRQPAPQQARFSFSIEPRSFPKIKQTVKQLLPPTLLKDYQIRDTEKQVAAAEKLRLKPGEYPQDIIPEQTVANLRANLSAIIDLLQQHQITVVLSTYPTLISPENIEQHYDLILDNRKFCAEFSFAGMIDAAQKLNQAVREIARDYHAGLVDNARQLPKETRYFADNVHYTDEGARRVAENVKAYLQQTVLPQFER